MVASQPVKRPMARPALPRDSSSGSGFFFCGIRLLPVAAESASSKNPNSSEVKRIKSSASRLTWTIANAALNRYEATKSRSPVASMLLATIREKPRVRARA